MCTTLAHAKQPYTYTHSRSATQRDQLLRKKQLPTIQFQISTTRSLCVDTERHFSYRPNIKPWIQPTFELGNETYDEVEKQHAFRSIEKLAMSSAERQFLQGVLANDL